MRQDGLYRDGTDRPLPAPKGVARYQKGAKDGVMKTPTKCGACKHIGNYTSGPYARAPHHCCELRWQLFEDDYRVDPDTLDENCPLKSQKLLEAIKECE